MNFDHVFGPADSSTAVYAATVPPLLRMALGGGVGTLFAYGQTGSGKTYTMTDIENLVADDIFCRARCWQREQESGSGVEFQRQTGSTVSEAEPAQVEVVERSADSSGSAESPSGPFTIYVAVFEVFGSNLFDLLADRAPVHLREDRFGGVQVQGLAEHVVRSGDEMRALIARAATLRRTEATLKNDRSSRAHAVCRVRIHNTQLAQAEDGVLYLVDLAGSERAADTRLHDASRIAETRTINTSLMALKECIRNRALLALGANGKRHVHVPYRTSRLTLLLRDAFELSSMRQCRTVIIATLAPCIADAAHSLNTLRYAAPIKVGAAAAEAHAPDPDNPAHWTHEQVATWVSTASHRGIDPAVLCPSESGLQLCRLPEGEFLRRCMLCSGISEKRAKLLYVRLWELVVDARTRDRRAAAARHRPTRQALQQKALDHSRELLARIHSETN